MTPQHILLLREIVSRMPHATLDELAAELEQLREVPVCTATIRRTLRSQGMVRLLPAQESRKAPASQPNVVLLKRYGYTAAHRREVARILLSRIALAS